MENRKTILMLLENDFIHDLRVKREASALSEAGFKVFVAAVTQKGENKIVTDNGITLYLRRMPKLVYKSSVAALKFPLYFSFWKEYVRDIFRDNLVDFIHIHDLPLCSIGVWARKRYKTIFIADLHENWPALLQSSLHTKTLAGRLLSSDKQWRKYEKEMVREADLIITIIEESGERLVKIGVDPAKICIVSNTFDPEEFKSIEVKDKTPGNELVLFYGGAINWHRGLQIVLKAIKLLAERNITIKMNIVGEGSFRNQLQELAASSGISDRIIFYGHKPAAEMFRILGESDLAVIPHFKTENNDASSPNKIYQYMYYGKPVISSDCESLKRIINSSEAGLIYEGGSAESLAEVLGNINTDRSRISVMGENGKKAARSTYDWQKDKSRLIAAYSHTGK